jgi:autotransporter-associated beta strand protein
MRAYLLTTTATAVALLAALPVRAQDATWLLNPTVAGPTPGTFDFNADANWTPATAPTGNATFGASNGPNLSFSAAFTQIGTWAFNSAVAYTFTNSATILEFTDSGIVVNGGSVVLNTNDGLTVFTGNSTGGNTRFVTDGIGVVDFSGTIGPGGNNQIAAGSIEGTGSYSLGSNQLTVGGNNLSTTVSATIDDGGLFGGSGASLVKIGTGTLTLSGVNTYSGGTTINAGTLAVSADDNLGAAQAVSPSAVARCNFWLASPPTARSPSTPAAARSTPTATTQRSRARSPAVAA